MRTVIAIIVAVVLANAWIPGIVALIASLDKAGFTFGAMLGFAVVVTFGFLFIYNLGWNHRGKDDESDAIEGIRKKTAAKQR